MFIDALNDTNSKDFAKLYTAAKETSNKKQSIQLVNRARKMELAHSFRKFADISKNIDKETEATIKSTQLTGNQKAAKLNQLKIARVDARLQSKRASLFCEKNGCKVRRVFCKKGYVKDKDRNCVMDMGLQKHCNYNIF